MQRAELASQDPPCWKSSTTAGASRPGSDFFANARCAEHRIRCPMSVSLDAPARLFPQRFPLQGSWPTGFAQLFLFLPVEDLPIEQIIKVAKKYGLRNLCLFGSRARGDATRASDLDLLVEYADDMGLLDVIGFEQELGDILGIQVETVSEASLHPIIKDRVLAEAIPLVAV